MPNDADFINALPKAELHIHIEGTIAPQTRLELAARNGITLAEKNVEEMRARYGWHDLASFMTVYLEGLALLKTEDDFSFIAYNYLRDAARQGVMYSEIFFDPQPHMMRGISFGSVIEGLTAGRLAAERDLGIRANFIMCFDRGLSAEFAMETLLEALPYKAAIVGIGLDSEEKGNPPIKFAEVYARAREEGFNLTAHCDVDQENTLLHIHQALIDLKVDRIDHGLNIIDDPALVEIARSRGVAFTVCPYANDIIRPGGGQPALREMLDAGLLVTINSDDPGYMNDYGITHSFHVAHEGANLSRAEMVAISRNALNAAWISDDERNGFLKRLADFAAANTVEMAH